MDDDRLKRVEAFGGLLDSKEKQLKDYLVAARDIASTSATKKDGTSSSSMSALKSMVQAIDLLVLDFSKPDLGFTSQPQQEVHRQLVM